MARVSELFWGSILWNLGVVVRVAMPVWDCEVPAYAGKCERNEGMC